MKKYLIPLVCIFAVVSAIGNVIAYKRYSSSRPLFTVNGEVIKRKDLDDRLDYLYSTHVLQKLIWNRLIMQEAHKANCAPTDPQIADTIADINRTSPAVIDRARLSDPQLVMFREDLATTMALRNLRIAGVTVTDDDARAFYAVHKMQFALPVQSQTTTVIAKDQLAATTARDLLSHGTEPALIAGQPGLTVVGIDAKITGAVPTDINAKVLQMHQGDIGTFPIAGEFMVVKINKRSPAVVPDFESIRDQVELATRVAKAPPAEQILRGLLERARIHAESDKYKNAIPDVTKDFMATLSN